MEKIHGEPTRCNVAAVDDFRRTAFPAPDGSIAGIEFGPAERPVDLLFVHANGFNARTYRGLLAPLAPGLRVLAIDQRGHGRTSLPADPKGRRSWRDLADDLVRLLDRIDGPPLTLAGHSMGGTASLLAAARRPGRVKRLVLVDPVVLPSAAAIAAWLPWFDAATSRSPMVEGALRRRRRFESRDAAFAALRGRGAFRTWPDDALRDYVADGFADTHDGDVELACAPEWEASNYAAQGHFSTAALLRLRCPATVLKAETGSTCYLAWPPRPGVSLRTVPGTTHFLPVERPDAVREALRGG